MQVWLAVFIHVLAGLATGEGKAVTKLGECFILLLFGMGLDVFCVWSLAPIDIDFGVPIELLTECVKLSDSFVLITIIPVVSASERGIEDFGNVLYLIG